MSKIDLIDAGSIGGYPEAVEMAKKINWDGANPYEDASVADLQIGDRLDIQGRGEHVVVGPNPTGIEPTEFKVLVLQDEVKETFEKAPSIIRADETKERDKYAAMTGKMIAVSPLAFTYERWPDGARKPRVGDAVVFAKYSGVTVTGSDGVEYRVMEDKDIIAIRTE